jgi:hypothetical protein
VGTRFFTKRGSNIVYSTILKSQEWLTINYVVNAIGLFCQGSTSLEEKTLQDDYIKFYKTGTCMAMQKKRFR